MSNTDEIVSEVRAGRMVVIMDDEARENEADLIMAGEAVTPEAVGFFVRHTSGIICQPMLRERLAQLRLPPMVPENTEAHRTAFTISVDLRHGTTTGISAHDRARTIRALADPASQPDDFARPGHIFPLRYTEGGVLCRAGHTEATIDLVRLAGFSMLTGILCEIVNDDGTMKRGRDLVTFAETHGLKMGTIEDLIRYRLRTERSVGRISDQQVRTEFGEFRMCCYEDNVNHDVHIALVRGNLNGANPPLVRVHVADTLRDVIGIQGERGPATARRHAPHRRRRRRRHRDSASARNAARFRRSRQGAYRGARQSCAGRRACAAHLRHRRADPAGPRREAHAGIVCPAAIAGARCLQSRDRRVRGQLSRALGYTLGPIKKPARAARMENPRVIEGDLQARDLKFAIVASRFNAFVVDSLVKGAVEALRRHGASDQQIEIVRVPGAFEMPPVVKKLASGKRFDAIVALGAVIRGDTPHFDYVAGECASGLARISMESGVPIGFGVLTVDTLEQAIDRAGGKSGNKGAEAAMTALELANLLRRLDV